MAKRFSRKEFLEALFGKYFKTHDGFIIVKTSRHLDRKLGTRYFPNIEILTKELYQPDQSVYFGVCPRESMKVDRADILYCLALWAGLDLSPDGYSGPESHFSGPAMAAKAVRSFPLPPSIIVESGRGMHLYWLIKNVSEIQDPAWVEQTLEKINGYFLCKKEVKLDSLLRLPGTFNCRMPGRSVLCEVKYLNTDFRYDLSDFEGLTLATDIHEDQAGRSHKKTSLDWTEQQPATTAYGSGALRRDVEDYTFELNQFLATESTTKKKLHGAPPLASSEPSVKQTRQTSRYDAGMLNEFEPVPYETLSEEKQPVPGELSPRVAELIADQIADKVLEKLSGKLINSLADEIVDRLSKRLVTGGNQ